MIGMTALNERVLVLNVSGYDRLHCWPSGTPAARLFSVTGAAARRFRDGRLSFKSNNRP